jgi:hypothetical protein
MFAGDRPLTTGAADVLRQMWLNGATQDGDLASKAGRVELTVHGLAAGADGWNWLTEAGHQAAITLDLGPAKDARDRRRDEQELDLHTRLSTIDAMRHSATMALKAVVKRDGGEVRLPQEGAFTEAGGLEVSAEGAEIVFRYVEPAPADAVAQEG